MYVWLYVYVCMTTLNSGAVGLAGSGDHRCGVVHLPAVRVRLHAAGSNVGYYGRRCCVCEYTPVWDTM